MMQPKLPPSSPSGKLSREDIKARLRLADQPKASMEAEDPAGAQFVLNVMQIGAYDKNPRQSVYEDFESLKEGIREQGFNGAFPVTRRPGDNTYMLAQGHNQRLRAVQELWQETADPKFRDVPVVYVRWTTESNNLARHLSENMNRSDMTFWDKATGFLNFKETREAEIGTTLTLRKLEEETKKAGIQTSITALSFFLFAAIKLAALRTEIHSQLTLEDIKTIQPAVNRFAAVYKILDFDEGCFTDDVLSIAIDTVNRESIHEKWSAKGFITACEQALGKKTHTSADHVRVMVAVNDRFPSLSKVELLEAAQNPKPEPLVKAAARQPITEDRPTPATPQPSEAINVTAPSLRLGAIGPTTEPTTSQDINGAQNLLDQIWRLIEQFAKATEITDLVRQTDCMPAGFYMEVQTNDEPNIDFDPREFRHAGWWMLASISGQLNRSLSTRLPANSTWRRAHQNEDPDLTLDYLVQERLEPVMNWRQTW
ncbi:MAG: ParB N-terminal domain-containing protein [Pseudomonadota bacterium]